MSELSKFNASHRITQELNNTLKRLNQPDFEFHLSNLMTFHELIKNNKPFRIIEDEADATIRNESLHQDFIDHVSSEDGAPQL